MMTASLTKQDALAKVRQAAAALALAQPGMAGYSAAIFRIANARLVRAQMAAADAGASSSQITIASEWTGMTL